MNQQPTLQSLAEQWAATYADIARADEKSRMAKEEADRLRSRCSTIAEQLSARVGRNVGVRVFDVPDNLVVIVEHERGLRLVKKQPKDQ